LVFHLRTPLFFPRHYTISQRIFAKSNAQRATLHPFAFEDGDEDDHFVMSPSEVIDPGWRFRVLSGSSLKRMSRRKYSAAEGQALPKGSEHARSGFPTTRWSEVRAAGESWPEGDDAFSVLCNDYRPPMFAYLLRCGFSEVDAQDLTQGFFVHLLEHRTVRRADPKRGRFRSFLLGALKNYLANEAVRARRQKRGGKREILSFDDPTQAIPEPSCEPEALRVYEQSWANEVMCRSVGRLREKFRSENRAELFRVLERFLGEATVSEEAAQALGSSIGALRTAVSRLRKQFGEQIRLEIARTVSAPHLIEEEFRHLRSVLEEM
jgi:DNA-directed RNA polymerase specialized sigma24 family protein